MIQLFALLLLATSAPAVREAPLTGGATLREIVLDGEILDLRTAPDGRILVLHAGVLTAWKIDEEPKTLAADLPEDVERFLLYDLDADGRDDILLGAPGRIFSLGPLAAPRAAAMVLEVRGLDLDALDEQGLLDPAGGALRVPDLDRLRRFVWQEGKLVESGGYDLPLRAERISTGIVLSASAVTGLWPQGTGPESGPVFLAGPDAAGTFRLRTTSYDQETREMWSRFRSPEKVERSWYRLHNGEPILIVATRRADQMGVFEKLKLRVFRLRDDRTRAGVGPSLEFETESIWWYPLRIEIADLDGDGREDLSVLQSEGLGGGKLVVTVFRGQSTGGRFEPSALESTVKLEGASETWGRDVTGDGVVDLVARQGRTLSVFTGEIDVKKRRVLGKKASLELSLPRGPLGGAEGESVRLGRPRVVDLDGDGRGEVLLYGKIRVDEEVEASEGEAREVARGILRVVRFTEARQRPSER